MTDAQLARVKAEIEAVEDTGYGRVEIVIHEKRIIEVRTTEVSKFN